MDDLRDLERLELAYLEKLAQRVSAIGTLSKIAAGPAGKLPATPIPARPGVAAPFASGSFASSPPGARHGDAVHLAAAVLEAEEDAWTRWADAIARQAAGD